MFFVFISEVNYFVTKSRINKIKNLTYTACLFQDAGISQPNDLRDGHKHFVKNELKF